MRFEIYLGKRYQYTKTKFYPFGCAIQNYTHALFLVYKVVFKILVRTILKLYYYENCENPKYVNCKFLVL